MKCAAHNAEAFAVCVWCGKALCPDCANPSTSKRMVCSDDCAAALAREARALDLVLQKSRQNTQASALYYYLCGALCAGGAVGAYFYLQVPFLIWFCAGCAVVFAASGTWYLWIARKNRE
jgi:predicted nucleic acid-binding Zn ribbon protein